MFKFKGIKSALVTSVVSLFLCVAMLVGTTFAWFTDSVTSANNVIQSGSLDIELSYSNNNTDWNKVTEATEPVFNYQYWEPGYTDVKYIKISNVGTLAFKYQLSIVPNIVPAAGEANLADVIDVYMFEKDAVINRDTIAAATPVGTLTELMAQAGGAANGVLLPAEGKGSTDVNLAEPADTPRGEITYCVVLKMQETAGNEYQNLTVGEGFSLNLLATQYTWENDSFDHLYDNTDIVAPPKAEVIVTEGKWIETSTHGDIWANTLLQFKPEHTYEEALEHPHGLYHADFVVKADKDIPAESIILPGYYAAFCDDYNNGKWVGLSSGDMIPAGTEIRLIRVLSDAMGGDITVNYEDICKFGNDGTGFLCGVSAVDNDGDGTYEAAGATLTVELRIYEVPAQGDCAQGGGCKHPYSSCELGEDKYITIGTYSYTVPTAVEAIDSTIVNDVAELKAALANGGNYVLTKDLVLDGNEVITAPAGVKTLLDLNGYTISASANKSGNQELFLVKGDLTVKNGSLNFTAENNQGWNSMATIFDVTAGGVLNLEGVTASVSGTDMNFIVHLNNWGTATLNVNDCDFTASYVAIRAFNSGYDMNNVTVKNTDFHGGRMFWVHNYTTEGKDDSTLNLDIYGNGNTTDNAKPIRFGFDNEIYFDINGNQI